MFFKISPDQDRRFPVQYALPNKLWLNVDAGWTELDSEHGIVYWKGYCYQYPISRTLADYLFQNPTPGLSGNYVAILVGKDGVIHVTHDDCRSTPLWINSDQLGNIGFEGSPVWTDTVCTFHNRVIVQEKYDAIGHATDQNLTFSDAVDLIHLRLTQHFQWLKKQRRPVRVFYSGGIDTLTCIAYLRAMDINHELITGEHYDYDKFTTEFSDELSHYWGYKQIHHWRESCFLVSGSPGDEYFMRGPSQCDLMLMHQGQEIKDILQPSDYHYDYFQSEAKIRLYQQQRADFKMQSIAKDRQLVCRQIIDMALNDHQHWHLGNTITFTPFRDLQILKTVLRLNKPVLERNMADATVQKALVERNDPELLQFLQPQKNQSRTATYQLWSRLYR
jgi:hypothetical protein